MLPEEISDCFEALNSGKLNELERDNILIKLNAYGIIPSHSLKTDKYYLFAIPENE